MTDELEQPTIRRQHLVFESPHNSGIPERWRIVNHWPVDYKEAKYHLVYWAEGRNSVEAKDRLVQALQKAGWVLHMRDEFWILEAVPPSYFELEKETVQYYVQGLYTVPVTGERLP